MFSSLMFTAPSVFVVKCLNFSQCISIPRMNWSSYGQFPLERKGKKKVISFRDWLKPWTLSLALTLWFLFLKTTEILGSGPAKAYLKEPGVWTAEIYYCWYYRNNLIQGQLHQYIKCFIRKCIIELGNTYSNGSFIFLPVLFNCLNLFILKCKKSFRMTFL